MVKWGVRSSEFEVRGFFLIFQVFFCGRVPSNTPIFYFGCVENGNFRVGNNYQRAYSEDNRVDVRDTQYNALNDRLQKMPLKHPNYLRIFAIAVPNMSAIDLQIIQRSVAAVYLFYKIFPRRTIAI